MGLDRQNDNSTCLDGIAFGSADRILLVNQSDPSLNGTWFARAPQADDFDGGSSKNVRVPATEVEEGGSR